MGFLNWFKNQPDENSEETQLGLFEQSQPVRSRVDGLTIRKEFTRTIQNKGGDAEAQAQSTERMTNILMKCSTEELYRETGATPNKRATLPADAQAALMMGEVAATHRLKQTNISGNQSQCNAQIVDTVEDASWDVEGLLQWNQKPQD